MQTYHHENGSRARIHRLNARHTPSRSNSSRPLNRHIRRNRSQRVDVCVSVPSVVAPTCRDASGEHCKIR